MTQGQYVTQPFGLLIHWQFCFFYFLLKTPYVFTLHNVFHVAHELAYFVQLILIFFFTDAEDVVEEKLKAVKVSPYIIMLVGVIGIMHGIA